MTEVCPRSTLKGGVCACTRKDFGLLEKMLCTTFLEILVVCFRGPDYTSGWSRMARSPFSRRDAFPFVESAEERIGILVAQQISGFVQFE